MRNHLVFAVAVVAGLGMASAIAGETSQASKPDPNEIICRSEGPVTGTRLGGRRICLTREQWQQRQQQAQDTLTRQQRYSNMGKIPGQ